MFNNPPQGPSSGPANYGQNEEVSPYSGMDNIVRYQDMIRYNTVSQYQQSAGNRSNIQAAKLQKMFYTNQKFQYGIANGDPNAYRRQQEMTRSATSTAIVKGAADMGAWELAAAGVGIAGGGGLIGAFAVPMAVSYAAMYPVAKGIEHSMEKRKYAYSIASDIESYRKQVGIPNLSYNDASNLGKDIAGSMFERGQYFSKEQQLNIHKLGVSNGLLDSKGGGLNSGSARQYKQNYKDLVETTKDVVKMLNTTIEGGMSVMKELQGSGFTNLSQIKQQIMQAKSFGTMTGIGSQNMMQLGVSGAQAVQGTGWSAMAGANAFQSNAAVASSMSGTSASAAYAVQRVGGAAQAGALLTQSQMAIASSGMGTKIMASMMNQNGLLNSDKMANVMGGKMSSYNVVNAANALGYGMGVGKVMFGMYKQDALNLAQQQDPNFLDKFQQTAFGLWGSTRGGNKRQQAYVFAGQFTSDDRSRRLMYESLTSAKGYDRQMAEQKSEYAALAGNTIAKKSHGVTYNAVAKGFGKVRDVSYGIGDGVMQATDDFFGKEGGILARGISGANRGIEVAGQMVGIYDQYGGYGATQGKGVGDTKDAYRAMQGLTGKATVKDYSVLASKSKEQVASFKKHNAFKEVYDFKFDVEKIFNNNSSADIAALNNNLVSAVWNDGANLASKSDAMRMLGIDVHDKKIAALIKEDPTAFWNSAAKQLHNGKVKLDGKLEASNTAVSNITKGSDVKTKAVEELRKMINSTRGATSYTIGDEGTMGVKSNLGDRGEEIRSLIKTSGLTVDEYNTIAKNTKLKQTVKKGDEALWSYQEPAVNIALAKKQMNEFTYKVTGRKAQDDDYNNAVLLDNKESPYARKLNDRQYQAKGKQKEYYASLNSQLGKKYFDVGWTPAQQNEKSTELVKTFSELFAKVEHGTISKEDKETFEKMRQTDMFSGAKGKAISTEYFNHANNISEANALITTGAAAKRITALATASKDGAAKYKKANLTDDILASIMTGGTLGAEAANKLTSAQKEVIGNALGNPQMMSQWIKEGTLGNHMMSDAKYTDANGIDRIKQLQDKMNRLRNLEDSVGDKKNSKVKNDYGGYMTKADIQKQLERVRDDISIANAQRNPGDTARGSGVYSNVSPPILNYWNNRWVL